MSRLIDADEFILEMEECKKEVKDKKVRKIIKEFISKIRKMPTAYDTHEVIKQINDIIQHLDEKNKICIDYGQMKSADMYANRMMALIKIVKVIEKGGVRKRRKKQMPTIEGDESGNVHKNGNIL